MQRYVVQRVALLVPTLFLVTVFVFMILRAVPGDTVTALLGEVQYSKQDEAAVRERLGLDRPVIEQYVTWIGGVVRGDFGVSLYRGYDVLPEILKRLPVTVELGLFAFVTTILVGFPIGVLSAVRQDTAVDYVGRSMAITFLSIPGFWLATIVIVIASLQFNWAPTFQYIPISEDVVGNLKQFVLPGVLLGVGNAAIIMRMTRAMLLEVMRSDYIRTARAKGLRESRVIFGHALRNALLPVITLMGLTIANLLGGTVIFEQIFGLPGMGRLLISSITFRDYTMIQGINLILATWIMMINLLVDLSYAYVDPRVRYG
jgi:peptide/nickel transport system permease protein